MTGWVTQLEERQAGRLHVGWCLEEVTSEHSRGWAINANGQPRVSLRWGRRRRSIATLWIRPWFGDRDPRMHLPASRAQPLLAAGPLEEHGIEWNVTWHTWDRDGVGGENAGAPNLCAALEDVLIALLRQGWIPDLRAAEVLACLQAASELARPWMTERKLVGIRWTSD